MRADWFLPVVRAPKPDVPERRIGILAQAARHMLPARFFSSRTTKQRGWFRRFLRWLGPVWLAAPVRRGVQSICFVTFLWLFFLTCWPYSAMPTRSSTGWIPAEFNFENSSVVLVADSTDTAEPPFKSGQEVFVRDDSEGLSGNAETATFRVWSVDSSEIRLEHVRRTSNVEHSTSNIEGSVLGVESSMFDIGRSMFEVLSLSPGPWSLHETDPAAWPSHYADNLSRKEKLAAELFLVIDPLVSLSTGIASRSWVWSLSCAGTILVACVFVPRGFCGYLCPLGTLIDLFDWVIGKRVTRFRVAGDGWWVHIKYYLLLGIIVAAFGGVLLSIARSISVDFLVSGTALAQWPQSCEPQGASRGLKIRDLTAIPAASVWPLTFFRG
jgi:hypothetical protein